MFIFRFPFLVKTKMTAYTRTNKSFKFSWVQFVRCEPAFRDNKSTVKRYANVLYTYLYPEAATYLAIRILRSHMQDATYYTEYFIVSYLLI